MVTKTVENSHKHGICKSYTAKHVCAHQNDIDCLPLSTVFAPFVGLQLKGLEHPPLTQLKINAHIVEDVYCTPVHVCIIFFTVHTHMHTHISCMLIFALSSVKIVLYTMNKVLRTHTIQRCPMSSDL